MPLSTYHRTTTRIYDATTPRSKSFPTYCTPQGAGESRSAAARRERGYTAEARRIERAQRRSIVAFITPEEYGADCYQLIRPGAIDGCSGQYPAFGPSQAHAPRGIAADHTRRLTHFRR